MARLMVGRDGSFLGLRGWTVYSWDLAQRQVQRARDFADLHRTIMSFSILSFDRY